VGRLTPIRPPSFTGIGDTPGVKLLKQERDAPDQPECDLSRIAIKLRRVHPAPRQIETSLRF
jgi:hypothetical protein